MDILIDSGAGLHACPMDHAPHVHVRAGGVVVAASALGHQMESQGRKTVRYKFEDGQVGVVDYQVGNVTRCILRAGLLASSGHTAVLAPNEAFI